MSKFEEISAELDKGDYDNFTDIYLLCVEIMRDFKVSHTAAMSIAKPFIYYNKFKSRTCETCIKKPKEGENFSFECGECRWFYADNWEAKDAE